MFDRTPLQSIPRPTVSLTSNNFYRKTPQMSGGPVPVPVLVVEILNVLAFMLAQNFTRFANPQSAKVAMASALSEIC